MKITIESYVATPYFSHHTSVTQNAALKIHTFRIQSRNRPEDLVRTSWKRRKVSTVKDRRRRRRRRRSSSSLYPYLFVGPRCLLPGRSLKQDIS
jgi:hypothetical protein